MSAISVSLLSLFPKRAKASAHIPARLQYRTPILKFMADILVLACLALALWVFTGLGSTVLLCLLAPLGIYMAGGYEQPLVSSRSAMLSIFCGALAVMFFLALAITFNLVFSIILAFATSCALLVSRFLLRMSGILVSDKPDILIANADLLNPYLIKSLEKVIGDRANLVNLTSSTTEDTNTLNLGYHPEKLDKASYLFTDFYSQMTGRAVFKSDGPDFSKTVNTNLRQASAGYRFSKRVLDIFLSGVPLLVFLPLFAIIYVAIRMESKGSPIFVQEREGLGGSILKVKKFRSMVENNSPSSATELWTSKNDVRLTKIGKLIRKFRLDELPQLITILEGTMSFVGPRPQRKFLNDMIPDLLSAEKELRLQMQPGLTGWAQVNGGYFGSSHDADEKRAFEIEKLRYDVYYAQHRTLLLDLKIFLLTFKTVLGRKGH